MDLELLRTFLDLNRTRHFGRSAENLHLTQAAVSSRLKSLESNLGVKLFERSRREMRLTPEGSRLVRHAERQIALWRAARQDVAAGEASEQLVIGGSLRLWDVVLQRWLHSLRRNFPQMAIIAESQSPETLTRRLIDGQLDVAIMLEPAQLDILQVIELMTIDIVCVSSSPNLDIEAAFEKDYVFVDWGLAFGLEHRRAFPDAPASMTRVSNSKMAYEYLSTVGGSAYLPRTMVSKDLQYELLHPVSNAPVFTRQVYATYPVRSPRLALIEQSLAFVQH